MNNNTIVAVFGYAGDAQQIHELMPFYEHHHCEIVIVSPEDSRIEGIKSCPEVICPTVFAGGRGYIGQITWDRQYLQIKALLAAHKADWYLLNDSDSFVLTPELPSYLYEDPMVIHSNEVHDFRLPGDTWTDGRQPAVTWPRDYHIGYPLIAMQPPYFASRLALERIVTRCEGLVACPITPFIDWWWVPACRAGRVLHEPFKTGASCETQTPHGIAVMRECISLRGATFIHSVKSGAVANQLAALHKAK